MGCNRTLTEQDIDQMLASAKLEDALHDVLSKEYLDHPESFDRRVVGLAVVNFDEAAVRDFVANCDECPGYANDVLNLLNQMASIPGTDSLLEDFVAGGTKEVGAQFQLSYVISHRGDIAEIAVPMGAQTKDGSWYAREGVDIVRNDGSVDELKCFDFSSGYYSSHAAEVAGAVVDQACSRLSAGYLSVTMVFAGYMGPMPSALAEELDAAIAEVGEGVPIDWRVEPG